MSTVPPDPVELLAHVVARALPAAPAFDDRDQNVDVDVFASHVAQQRVSGLVLAALERGALAGQRDEVRASIEPIQLDALRTSLAAESVSIEVSECLAAAGIRHALLKGCATAQLDYPDPALRITGDVDLLVGRVDYEPALAQLESFGLERLEPPFRVNWERRYGKDIPLIGAGRIEVDLHLALASGYFGMIMGTERLLDDLDVCHVAGRELPTLDVCGRLLHAAVHTATTTPIRLGSAADVIQIAARDDFALGPFVDRITDLRCDGIVANGISRAWSTFGVEPTALSQWAAGHVPDDGQRRAMSSLAQVTGESRWASGLAAVPWFRRVSYVAPLMVPSRAYLAHRNRTLPEHLRTSIRRTRPTS